MSTQLDQEAEPAEQANRRFATTRWSIVIAARHTSRAESRQALESLCQTYWHPLYFFVRRKGHDPDEAEDLIQGFFLKILDKKILWAVHRERGKFRTFLLKALEWYLANEYRKARAEKRGGGQVPLSLDFESAEDRYRLEIADNDTPDTLFARHWAQIVLDQALTRVRLVYESRGNQKLFERLSSVLLGDSDAAPLREIGQDLGMTEGAVKGAAHRLRKCYADCLRQEIAETVAKPEQIEEEIQMLFSSLG